MNSMRPAWILLLVALIWSAAASCSGADDAQPSDAAGAGCEDAICGTISYSGAYTGPPARIYVRAYKGTDSLSNNPLAAVGQPDFETSIEALGDYRIELGGYEGPVTLSAFMDVDSSGSALGPNGRPDLLHGLYSDPIGAFGGYTFDTDPQTAPTPLEVDASGAVGIDIALTDSGVITGTVSGAFSGTLIVGAFVPEVGGPYLHHTEYAGYTDGMTFFVVAPAKTDWRVRATVAGTTGFYPENPPPAPPANTTPVEVVANAITYGIDIDLQ